MQSSLRALSRTLGGVLSYMESFLNDGFPVWLLLFPDGTTTIHTECVLKSQACAAAQDRPMLERALLPGAAGLLLGAHDDNSASSPRATTF
ncbi:hypothetical protein SPRG_16314 [Saprolegnia parasitica CBS 223.65]|uniref:Uncharacterized protein n=1 Tax=Saprolegnia parasitica (strain CBS 223.65) TaxID=695850 RepID=A0A067BUK5_SAPPC|nr:hypothetical protein SPRG_16314 [Saprolegnia parasitica CBS 223.65]KDO18292.1 hypothetical protein SPRG_16314 [Saprolegnia parasitica CBS 223.65]|eukprot:XP_012211000.1 hypothetical protein SPRG_16314 [Saprolegnia parasitica CBS 223.65]